jgi:hypothetical protein
MTREKNVDKIIGCGHYIKSPSTVFIQDLFSAIVSFLNALFLFRFYFISAFSKSFFDLEKRTHFQKQPSIRILGKIQEAKIRYSLIQYNT